MKPIAILVALAVLSTSSASADLIGLYSFDDAANPLKDDSSAGNHLTGTAGTNPLWGLMTGFNNSGAFDYSSDRLVVPINVSPGPMPNMTWGAWVRTDTLASGLYKVLGHDDGAWDRTIGLDNRNPATLRYTSFTGNDGVNASGPVEGTPGPVSTTDWTFIAASYNQIDKTVTVFVDLDASTTADPLVVITEPAGFGSGASTFAIGGISPNNAGEAWDGAIDNVFIYNESLTAAKMTAIRDRGLPELKGIPVSDPDIGVTPVNLYGDLRSLGPQPGPMSRMFTIRNTGASLDLNISITVTGPDAAHYTFPSLLPAVLSPGDQETVEVLFTPPAAGGNFVATLEIASDDPDTAVSKIGLNAQVTSDPNFEVTYAAPLFGRVTFETVPAFITRSITLRNSGTANPLTINPPVISGASAGSYAVVSTPTTIAPGSSADLEVSLLPGEGGDFVASLEITSDDPDSPSVTVPLNASVLNVVSTNLVGLYSFDDASNPLADDSGFRNHITGTGGTDPVWGPGTGFQASGAYDFSNDRLVAPININPGVMPRMTWGAWVRTDTLAGGLRKVLGHDDGAWDRTIGLDNRNPAVLRYTSFTGNDAVNASGPVEGTPGPVSTTDWTFFAASYDQVAKTVTVYVDLDASTTEDSLVVVSEPAGFGNGASTIAIGGISPNNGGEPWDGAIDNVFVYNTELTLERVTAIRDRGLRELLEIPMTDPDIAAPTSLFGDLRGLGVAPGTVTRTAVIRNLGVSEDLDLSSLAITGPDAGLYLITSPLPTTIPPGDQALVDIEFTPPPAGGSFVAALNIASNDEDTPNLTITLDAQVTTDPELEVIRPLELFGRMTFNEVPALITRSITVRNRGVANSLTIDPPTISGPNAANYSIVSAPTTLAPGETADIVVALAPGAAASFVASLRITSSDPDSAGVGVSLNGSVVIVPPATLVAFYSFDEESAPFTDDSGNGHDITDSAGTDPVWGPETGFQNSGAFEFSNDRLIAPVNVNPSMLNQMTWGAWVRTDSTEPALRKVLGHDNGAWDRVIGLDNRAGNFRYTSFTGDNPVNASGPVEGLPGPVNTTDWTFLAATYDQTALTVTVYLDLDASTATDPLVAVTEPAGFGAGFDTFAIGGIRPDNPGEAWAGAIDNVFVYDGILTDAQLTDIRNRGKFAIYPEIRVSSIRRNPDGTVTLTWNSSPAPGTTYAVLFNNNVTVPLSDWADDADSVPTQGATTTYTTENAFALDQVFFVIRRN